MRKLLLAAFLVLFCVPAWSGAGAPQPPRVPVHIVTIDKTDIDRNGGWPFDRSIHAAVLRRITQGAPREVVLNMYFSDPMSRRGDADLAAAIQQSGRTWILVGDEGQPPIPELARVAHGLGHSIIVADDGGDGLAGSSLVPVGRYNDVTLEAVMDWLGVKQRPQLSWEGKSLVIGRVSLPAQTFPINFDETIHFPHYTYRQILNPQFNPACFKNGIVLIGVAQVNYANHLSVQGRHDNYYLFPVESMAYAIPDLVKAFFPEPSK